MRKKTMFVHACVNVGGWGDSDCVKNRYYKRDTESDRTQLNLVFSVKPVRFAGFSLQ